MDLRQLYDAPLMLNSLPASIDPLRLADEGAHLVGHLSTRPMRRLAAAIAQGGAPAAPETDSEGQASQVSINLQFGRSPQGVRQMQGTIKASLSVRCQRCLQEMTVDLLAEPALVLLPDKGANTATEEGDTLVVKKPLALIELVEEELLLAMPMIPKHPEDACGIRPAEGATPAPGPLAGLNILKK